jgi:heme oxygenase
MAPLHDETPGLAGAGSRPSLLLALRRAVRPDRARVATYETMALQPAGWASYAEFLQGHRAWLAALDRALVEAGEVHPVAPLLDGAPQPGEVATAEAIAPPRTRAQALGYLYVFEAFRLGCSVLARRIRGFGQAPEHAGRPWGALVKALGRVPPEDHAAVVQGAREAFAQWERRLGGSLARLGMACGSAGAQAA